MATDYIATYEELWEDCSDLKDECYKALSLVDELVIELEVEYELLKKIGGNINAATKCEEKLRKL